MINPWQAVYDHPQSVDPFGNGVPPAPLYLDLEATNKCTFSCKFCVRKQMQRPRGCMDLSLYDDIITQAQKMGVEGVRFLRWGEPLLHDDIVKMISLANEKGLLTHITTNGYFLTVGLATKLMFAGLDSMIVSFQGTTQEEYEKIRSPHYDDIVNNIINFVHLKESSTAETPFLQVNTTVTDETKEDVDRWKDYWSGIVDGADVHYTWFRRLKNQTDIADLIARATVLPHNFKCVEVMNKLSIDWDGAVSPCCLDYDQQLTMGNIKNTSLQEFWNSDNLAAIRRLLSNKMQDMFVLCSTCELNSRFRGKK